MRRAEGEPFPSMRGRSGSEEEELYAGETYAEEKEMDSPQSQQQHHHQQQSSSAPPVDTSLILGRVENYLLPQVDFYNHWSSAKRQRQREAHSSASSVLHDFEVSGLCPLTRLDDILYQVALADHIRTMQTMYRDAHDEHRLVSDLRADHPHTTLPTKQLLTKITEGRVRIQALCRLCHGDESVEMLRATVDLASAYALQGMWQQVSEHMAAASQKLVAVTAPQRREAQVLQAIAAREAAAKVEATYRCLRAHAIANSGQVTRQFLREIVIELAAVVKIVAESGTGAAAAGARDGAGGSGSAAGAGGEGVNAAPSAHSQPTQMAALLHAFFIRFSAEQAEAQNSLYSRGSSSPKKAHPSWGDVVDFLRHECVLMRQWVREMEAGVLPQNKAVLLLPFRQADKQKRGVAHPQQLAYYLARMPSAAKALAGSTVVKRLQALKIELPLLINPATGDIKFPEAVGVAGAAGAGGVGGKETVSTPSQKVRHPLYSHTIHDAIEDAHASKPYPPLNPSTPINPSHHRLT